MVLPTLVCSCTSHFELGSIVGSTFASSIRRKLSHPSFLPVLTYAASPSGSSLVSSFLSIASNHFPQYVDELRGVASGSALPFDAIFTLAVQRELFQCVFPPEKLYPKLFAAADEDEEAEDLGNCTDVLVSSPGTGFPLVLGHNEDGGPDEEGNCYLLSATIFSSLDKSIISECFTTFCYSGLVGGTAFGFNSSILYTNNAVIAKQTNMEGGVPRFFVNRSILAATSVADAQAKLSLHLPCTAFNVNVCSLKRREVGGEPAVSLECHPFDGVAVHCHADDDDGLYMRSNHYLHHSIEKCVVTPSSRCRLETVLAFSPAPKSEEDVRRCLAVETGDDAPVYWKKGGKHVTHCTAIVDFNDKVRGTVISRRQPGN